MKPALRVILFVCFSTACGAATASLLSANKFPSTVSDLSFADRVRILQDGYETYESEFDANGNCISGCAYPGITLAQVVAESDNATQQANENLVSLYQESDYYDDVDDDQPETDSAPVSVAPAAPIPPAAPAFTPNATVSSGEYGCPSDTFSKYIPHGNKYVNHAPLDTDLIIVSDIGERHVANGSSWHQGIDMRAADDTPVYLPANGIVTTVAGGPSSSAGYYINVYHPGEKIYTRYLHLSKRLVKKGDKIAAGCMIAKSGHSGTGRKKQPYAPHLHYEIKKSETLNRSDVIDPFGGINRLGRSYKFKSSACLRPSRNGQCPIGCTGFLY